MMWPSTKDLDWQSGQRRILVIAKWKLAVVTLSGLLAILAFAAGYFAWSNRQETQAGIFLFKAVNQLEASTRAGENGAKQEEGVRLLQEVATRYPATAAGAEATLRLANIYYTVGKYDEARSVYTTYLAKNPKGRIAFSAGLGLGDTYLAQGDYQKAEETYSGIIERFPQEPLLPEAQLHLAKAYLGMNRLTEATALYEKVKTNFPNTGWAQSAQAELVKTPLH